MGKIKYIPKRLAKKNINKAIKLQAERNEARLKYPVDIRIDLSNKLCLEGLTDNSNIGSLQFLTSQSDYDK